MIVCWTVLSVQSLQELCYFDMYWAISKQTVMLSLALFFHTDGNQAVNLSVRSLDLIGVMSEGGEGQTGPKRSRLIQNFAAENPKQ